MTSFVTGELIIGVGFVTCVIACSFVKLDRSVIWANAAPELVVSSAMVPIAANFLLILLPPFYSFCCYDPVTVLATIFLLVNSKKYLSCIVTIPTLLLLCFIIIVLNGKTLF
jgi:uncharacterized membrane protein